MSDENFSYKNFYKMPNEKNVEIRKKINFQKFEYYDEENNENNQDNQFNNNENGDEKMDEKIKKEIGKNNHNLTYMNESYFNNFIFRRCFNYYLSYFFEQDFIIEDKDEPKNSSFISRIFGNHPKIYSLLPELKSEKNFIIFLKQNTQSTDNEIFKNIFTKILDFFNNGLGEEVEEDKIFKTNNPLNLLTKSNRLLKEKMKSYNIIKTNKKDYFEEYKINSIPILMLLQSLYMIEKYPNFIELFINKFFSHEKEIIIALSFYLSNISFDRLLSGRLNVFFDKTKLVLDTYEEFFLGLFSLIFDLFDANNGNYHKIFSELESEAINMPSSIFWKCKIFKLKYQEMGLDSSLSSYFNDSISNPK